MLLGGQTWLTWSKVYFRAYIWCLRKGFKSTSLRDISIVIFIGRQRYVISCNLLLSKYWWICSNYVIYYAPKSQRNVSSTLLNLCHKELRLFFFWGFRVCIYLGLLKSVFYFPFARWGKSFGPSLCDTFTQQLHLHVLREHGCPILKSYINACLGPHFSF